MIRLFFYFLKYYTSSFCSFFFRLHDTSPIWLQVDQPNSPFLFRMRLVIVACPPRPPVSVSFIRRCIGGVQYGSGTWWLCVLPLYPDGVFQFLKCSVAFFFTVFFPILGPMRGLGRDLPYLIGLALLLSFLVSFFLHIFRALKCALEKGHFPCPTPCILSVKIDLTADPFWGLRWWLALNFCSLCEEYDQFSSFQCFVGYSLTIPYAGRNPEATA